VIQFLREENTSELPMIATFLRQIALPILNTKGVTPSAMQATL
jgi:hypothetical protein